MELLVLRGGTVVDGTPSAVPAVADVVVEQGRIAAVAPAGTFEAAGPARELDCGGYVVAPGFIDIHTHSDLTRLAYPFAESRIQQGITTEVIGNCGMSPAPVGPAGAAALRAVIGPVDVREDVDCSWDAFEEFLDVIDSAPSAVNTAALVGHGAVRHAVMGNDPRPAGARERDAIAGLVDEALSGGAWGVSFGLMYSPGELADAAELRAVAGAAGRSDALVAAHVRSYLGQELERAVDEFLDITDAGRIQVSHLRAIGAAAGGVAQRTLQRLHARRAAGVDIGADAYPYTAGQTTALQLLPADVRRLGPRAVLEEISGSRDRLAAAMRESPFPPEAITITRTGTTPTEACGRTLADLAHGGDDWPAVLFELLERHMGAVDVIVVGSELDDVEATLRDPLVSIASDGVTLSSAHTDNLPHPRSFGTFPRALRMLLDAGLSLGEAVSKATSLPADRLGMRDRGRLEPGAVADIVVMRPLELRDNATYSVPMVAPSGIRDVLVGGEYVLRDGVPTGACPGTLLRRAS